MPQVMPHPLGALSIIEGYLMSVKNLCIVILRVLGIYCFIEAFVLMQGLYFAFTMPAEFSADIPKMLIASTLPSLFLILIGAILIVFSKKLANIITPSVDIEQTNLEYSLRDIQSILFSVVGVLVFLSAIPRMFTWISQLVSLIANDNHGLPYNSKGIRDNWISLTLSIVQMSLGIGLFFGAKKLSSYWYRMREWIPNK